MYEVPKDWSEMTREEHEAWVAAVLKKLFEESGGVPRRIVRPDI